MFTVLKEDDDYDEEEVEAPEAAPDELGTAAGAENAAVTHADTTRQSKIYALSLQDREIEQYQKAQRVDQPEEVLEEDLSEDEYAQKVPGRKQPRKFLHLLFSYSSSRDAEITRLYEKKTLKSKSEVNFKKNMKRLELLSEIERRETRNRESEELFWRLKMNSIPKGEIESARRQKRKIMAEKAEKMKIKSVHEPSQPMVANDDECASYEEEIDTSLVESEDLANLDQMDWEKKVEKLLAASMGEDYPEYDEKQVVSLILEQIRAKEANTLRTSDKKLRLRTRRTLWGDDRRNAIPKATVMFESIEKAITLRDIPKNPRLEKGDWLKEIVLDEEDFELNPKRHRLVLNWEDDNLLLEDLELAKEEKKPELEPTGEKFDHAEAMKQARPELAATEEVESDFNTIVRNLLVPVENSFAAAQLQTTRLNYVDVDPFKLHRPKLCNITTEKQRYEITSFYSSKNLGSSFYWRELTRNPSGAIKLKHLSGRANQLLLFEYIEENPILLLKPGMACRILNIYNSISDTLTEQDATYEEGMTILLPKLRESIKESRDPSAAVQADFGRVLRNPFISELPLNTSTQMIYSNLFRAPFYKHRINKVEEKRTKTMDFLLVRTRSGKIFIRKLDSVCAVSHVLPNELVIVPKSRQSVDFGRKVVEAFIDRAWGGGKTLEAELNMKSLPFDLMMRLFKGLINFAQIKQIIEHPKGSGIPRAFFKSSQMGWERNDMYHPPSEDIIRQRLTPEHVCVYEAMIRGVTQLRRIGLRSIATLSVPLTNALIALHAHPLFSKAASVILEALCYAPWISTKNYVEENVKGLFMQTRSGERFFIRISPRQSERALLRGDQPPSIPPPAPMPLLRNLDKRLYTMALSAISEPERRTLRGSAIEALVETELNRLLLEDELVRIKESGREQNYDPVYDKKDVDSVRVIYSMEREVRHRKTKDDMEISEFDGMKGAAKDGHAPTRARSSAFRMAEKMEKRPVEVDIDKVVSVIRSILPQVGSERRKLYLLESMTNNKSGKFEREPTMQQTVVDPESVRSILLAELTLAEERARILRLEREKEAIEDDKIARERKKSAMMVDSEPRIKISSQHIGGTQLKLKFQTHKRKGGKKKRINVDYDGGSDDQADQYEIAYTPRTKRRRTTTGEVEFNNLLATMLEEMNRQEGSQTYFYYKVDGNREIEYYKVVTEPMTLGMMQEKVRNFKYKSIQEFRDDVALIYENCVKYNTSRYASLIPLAENLKSICEKRCEENKDQLEEYETMIQRAYMKDTEEGAGDLDVDADADPDADAVVG